MGHRLMRLPKQRGSGGRRRGERAVGGGKERGWGMRRQPSTRWHGECRRRECAPPPGQVTEGTRRERKKAARVGRAAAVHTARVAARKEAEEAALRGRMLTATAEDGAATSAERRAVEEVEAAAGRWRTARGVQLLGPESAEAGTAARAARRIRRRRPAADAAAEERRARAVLAVAQVLEAVGALRAAHAG